MAPQDGWTVCIWNLWNTEVDFRLFSRQKHTISRTFEVSESESDFAHFGSEGCGWVLHIDVVIWHFDFEGLLFRIWDEWRLLTKASDWRIGKSLISCFWHGYFQQAWTGVKRETQSPATFREGKWESESNWQRSRDSKASTTEGSSAKLIELKAFWNMFTPDVLAFLFLCLRSSWLWNISETWCFKSFNLADMFQWPEELLEHEGPVVTLQLTWHVQNSDGSNLSGV